MYKFRTSRLEGIVNRQYKFEKLWIDDCCQFDDFEASLTQPKEIASLQSIYNLMDNFGTMLLPKTKFRRIIGKKRDSNNLYKFKKDNIRVYVQFIKPHILVIIGGYKKRQDADISKAFSILKELEKTD